MKLAYLADYPEFFPLVAQWNWDEWHTLLVERSAAEFEVWLRENVRSDAIPMTLLAFEETTIVGTVSVMDFDLELSNDLTPWLASLYVVPSHRGKGLGRKLVQAAIDEAKRLGFSTLYLYTPGQASFYSELGWVLLKSVSYRGQAITIMKRIL